MENTVYASFRNPSQANEAFIELIQRGASYMDLVVLTKRTYRDPAFDPDDGRLDVPESVPLEPDSAAPSEASEVGAEGNMRIQRDPFGDTPGGMWLIDNLRFPGDLAVCLKELGFARDLAHEIETDLLAGGAMVILRVPSGPVDDVLGWQVIEHHAGKALAPKFGNPYLG